MPGLTSTPTATLTPTTTLTPNSIPDSYGLPEWMAGPDLNIMMTISDWINNEFQLSFWGEETGQRFDIPLPSYIGGYFWPDNQHFGLLDSRNQQLLIVDLQTGVVTTNAINPQAFRFFNPDCNNSPCAISLSPFPMNSDKFLIINAYSERRFSKNWDYLVQRHYDQKESYSIQNIETSASITITTEQDNVWLYDYEWSKIVPDEIAILLSDEPKGMYYQSGNRISIVNAKSGQIISTSTGEFGLDIDWSFDGEKFLFQPRFDHSPCYLTASTDQVNCIDAIKNIPEGENGYIFWIKWSDDGTKIYYIENKDDSLEEKQIDHLCLYNLLTGENPCIGDGIEGLSHWYINQYKLSPDERFVALRVEILKIFTELHYSGYSAIMTIDGENFQLLVDPAFSDKQFSDELDFRLDNNLGIFGLLWRPMP